MAFSHHFQLFLLVCLQIDVFRWPRCFLGGFAHGLPECSLLFPGVLWMVTVILEWLLLFPVVFCCTPDGPCYFLVRSAWSLLFLGVLWMVVVVYRCALHGHCHFLVYSGWSLLFPLAPWMVTVFFRCPLDGHYYFLVRAQATHVTHRQTQGKAVKRHQINRDIVRGRTCPNATNVCLKSPEATRCPLPPSLQEHHAPAPNKTPPPPPPRPRPAPLHFRGRSGHLLHRRLHAAENVVVD